MLPLWAAVLCGLLHSFCDDRYSVFVLVFCMELANRIELGVQIERAEVGAGGLQPVSEEATPASQVPKTSAPAWSWAAR